MVLPCGRIPDCVASSPDGTRRRALRARPITPGYVSVLGKVSGSIQASERVSIGESGSVEGPISAPRLVVADGAHVQGRVDVQAT